MVINLYLLKTVLKNCFGVIVIKQSIKYNKFIRRKYMATISKDYFGLGRLVSVILAIIPFTSFVLGVVTRFCEKHFLAAILRLVLGWNIIWILDIICMIRNHKILRIL